MRRTSKNELYKINKDIKSYMELLDTLDKEDKNNSNIKISTDYIKNLEEKRDPINKDLEFLDTIGKEQYNRTDKDANVISKPAHNLMAYALNEVRKCSWGIILK